MFTFHPEQSHHLIRQHEADAQRAANHYRLVRVVHPGRPAGVFRPLLVSLGKRLVAWGTTLENRYDECADVINDWTNRESVHENAAFRT